MKIGILGTGAYGLAIAKVLKKNNNTLTMWTKFEQERDLLLEKRSNEKVLPGIYLEEEIELTCDMKKVLTGKEMIVIAIPIEFLEDVVKEMKENIKKDQVICLTTKGIEKNQGLFAREIIVKYMPSNPVVVLSGPTFAIDLAKDTVCELTSASNNEEALKMVKKSFASKHLSIEETPDVIGVEVCGALKNIMALASGIITGLRQSDSTKAFFEKESLLEMKNLIEHLGGKKETILTSAGVGDLLLTCNSVKSRNYTYGTKVGKKEDTKKYLETTTVEGIYTLMSIKVLLEKKKIHLPLIEIIYNICIKKENPEKLLTALVEKKEDENERSKSKRNL